MRTKRILWLRCYPATDEQWPVFLVPKTYRALGVGPLSGSADLGSADFDARTIYVSYNQRVADVYATLLHEYLHVAIHHMRLPTQWEESIVAAMEQRLATMVASSPFAWPPIPPEALRHMKERDHEGIEVLDMTLSDDDEEAA